MYVTRVAYVSALMHAYFSLCVTIEESIEKKEKTLQGILCCSFIVPSRREDEVDDDAVDGDDSVNADNDADDCDNDHGYDDNDDEQVAEKGNTTPILPLKRKKQLDPRSPHCKRMVIRFACLWMTYEVSLAAIVTALQERSDCCFTEMPRQSSTASFTATSATTAVSSSSSSSRSALTSPYSPSSSCAATLNGLVHDRAVATLECLADMLQVTRYTQCVLAVLIMNVYDWIRLYTV